MVFYGFDTCFCLIRMLFMAMRHEYVHAQHDQHAEDECLYVLVATALPLDRRQGMRHQVPQNDIQEASGSKADEGRFECFNR